MFYYYKVVNSAGVKEEGSLEAGDMKGAARALSSQGFRILNIEEKQENKFEKIKNKILNKSLDDKTVALFCRQLSILLETEPLHKIIHILEKESKDKKYARILKDLGKQVEEGKTLYNALSKHSESFSESIVSLIRAGEESGELKEILERLANYLEKIADAKEKFKGAMIYPALLMCVTFGLIFIMFSFVIPSFSALFESMNAELPPLTKFVVSLGDFVSENSLFILFFIIFFISGFFYLLQYEKCKLTIDKLILRLPLWGDFTMHAAWSKILVTLAMLIRGGFRMDEALKMSKDVSENLVLKNFLDSASKKFSEGYSLTAIFKGFDNIPNAHFQLIAAGEKSGRLEEVLLKGAEFSDKEMGYVLKRIESITAPLLTLIVGAVVLLFALSVILPVFSLTEIF